MAATAIYRPHTAMSFTSTYKQPEIKLGEEVLLPGFQKHLEDFYLKATPQDRLRCAELITDLDQADDTKERTGLLGINTEHTSIKHRSRSIPHDNRVKRPQTAMANLEQYRDPFNPYTTTYKREYTAIAGAPGQADRPQTARHQVTHELSAPLGASTYQTAYYGGGSKPTAISLVSPDDHKRNNPHPTKDFMVWRLARGAKMSGRGNWSELTDQLMDEVMRGQIASTYQNDYLGIPQGKQGLKSVQQAFGDLTDTRNDVPYTLNTSTRRTFQTPQVRPELQGNTVRYGCNKQKHISVGGVVPTVSSRYLKVKSRTTYAREYNTNNNGCSADDIRKMKEKEALERMMNNFKPHSPTNSQSSSIYRPRPTRCLETPTSPPAYH